MKGPAGEVRHPRPFFPVRERPRPRNSLPRLPSQWCEQRRLPFQLTVSVNRFPNGEKKRTPGRVTDREGLGETSARNRERGKTQQGKRDTSSSRNVPDKGEEVKVVGAAIAYEECRFPFQLGKNLPVALASFCFRRECCPNVYKEMRELIGAGKRNKQKSVSPQLRVFSPLVYAEVSFFFFLFVLISARSGNDGKKRGPEIDGSCAEPVIGREDGKRN